jgi:acetyl-CoA acyltransferase 1
MDRLLHLQQQLVSSNKKADDVVICAAVRTPLTKAKKGGLKDTQPDILMKTVFT